MDPGPDAKSTGAPLLALASCDSPETAPTTFRSPTSPIWRKASTLAAERGPSGSIVSLVDDRPTAYRELFAHIALMEGAAGPTGGGASNFPSFRVANSRARDILGWRPFYRSYRSGLT